MKKTIIKDWAGNILTFRGVFERPEFAVAMEFESEDDANAYIAEMLEDCEDDVYYDDKPERGAK